MSVNIDGVEWKEYTISWVSETDGRPYEGSIFATSEDHALEVVKSMKNSLTLGDEIVGRVAA